MLLIWKVARTTQLHDSGFSLSGEWRSRNIHLISSFYEQRNSCDLCLLKSTVYLFFIVGSLRDSYSRVLIICTTKFSPIHPPSHPTLCDLKKKIKTNLWYHRLGCILYWRTINLPGLWSENCLSLSQLTISNSSTALGWYRVPNPSVIGFGLAWACTGFEHAATASVSPYVELFAVCRTCYLVVTHHSSLPPSFHFLFCKISEPCKGFTVVYTPSRADSSAVSYLLNLR